MHKKYIAPLIWLLAGGIMCAFLLRLANGVDRMQLSQIFLFYGALYTADAGFVVGTLVNRKENLSVTNFGFKLMAEVLVFLALVTFMIGDIFFA